MLGKTLVVWQKQFTFYRINFLIRKSSAWLLKFNVLRFRCRLILPKVQEEIHRKRKFGLLKSRMAH